MDRPRETWRWWPWNVQLDSTGKGSSSEGAGTHCLWGLKWKFSLFLPHCTPRENNTYCDDDANDDDCYENCV